MEVRLVPLYFAEVNEREQQEFADQMKRLQEVLR